MRSPISSLISLTQRKNPSPLPRAAFHSCPRHIFCHPILYYGRYFSPPPSLLYSPLPELPISREFWNPGCKMKMEEMTTSITISPSTKRLMMMMETSSSSSRTHRSDDRKVEEGTTVVPHIGCGHLLLWRVMYRSCGCGHLRTSYSGYHLPLIKYYVLTNLLDGAHHANLAPQTHYCTWLRLSTGVE